MTRCRVLIGSHGDGEDDEVLQLEVQDPPRGLGARPQHQHAVLRTLEREHGYHGGHAHTSDGWGQRNLYQETGELEFSISGEESPKIYNP